MSIGPFSEDEYDDWGVVDPVDKLSILENESTVEVGLLMENKLLINMIKMGASKEFCLEFINECY